MIRELSENLSRGQKIGIFFAMQIFVVILLVSIAQTAFKEKEHVEIRNDNYNNEQVPDNVKEFVAKNIWTLLQTRVDGISDNKVDDVVIRGGSLETVEKGNGDIGASFIVDIDSLKQTFVIKTGWSQDGSTVYEVVVDCPSRDEMKYKETVCHGTYNDTYSLDLYLPYSSQNEEGEDTYDYYIWGDEYDKAINIIVSGCDVDKYKKEAKNYLNSTPIKQSEYTINYEVNYSDIVCD